jgi:sulfur carrier protein ThiS adenylyltransferase
VQTLERFERQGELVPQEVIRESVPFIAGVGAIGRQVAMQLAAIGCPKLHVYDFDEVDTNNITTQMYRVEDIGKPKVEALADDINHYLGTEIEIVQHNQEFGVADMVGVDNPVTFCCVDTMHGRKDVAESCQQANVPFFVDGRMTGENIRIVTAVGDYERYLDSLVDDGEVAEGRCTTHSTVFAANLAAGLMLFEYTLFLRGIANNDDTLMCLAAGMWTPTP